ncbi:hypothetical protein ACOMHN_018033 [Nucella lapillus]
MMMDIGCQEASFIRVQGPGEGTVGSSHYVQSVSSPTGTPPPSIASPKGGSPTLSSPSDSNLLAPPGTVVTRKCSLIHEESLDEYDDDDDDDVDIDAATIKPVKSLESLDELGTTGHVTLMPASPPATSPPALLLNQIHEENESEDDDDVVPLKLSTPRRFAGSSSSHRNRGPMSPEMLRKYEQRKKRGGAGQRGTSCSSSDASDTDDTESRSRKEKLQHKFIHRRDSSDHSSDTDGPGGNLGSNGRLGAGSGSRGTSGGSRTQGGNGGGSGRGGGGRGGDGGKRGGSGEKKNSDNRNHSNNNKNSVNNHKNSQYHGGGSSKGSLTDASLKLLSRKLNEISTGVGVLLLECRGSDCDHDSSPSPAHPPTPSTPRSLDGGQRSGSSGSLQQQQRHSRATSVHSSSSLYSTPHPDTHLFPLNEQFFSSPAHYLGQSCEVESLSGHPLEFSQLSQCVSSRDAQCSELDHHHHHHPSHILPPCGVGVGGGPVHPSIYPPLPCYTVSPSLLLGCLWFPASPSAALWCEEKLS